MQLVAAASEPKYVAAAGGAGGGGGQSLQIGSQEPKFAPFSPLAVSTSGSHENHQQKGKKSAESFWHYSPCFDTFLLSSFPI